MTWQGDVNKDAQTPGFCLTELSTSVLIAGALAVAVVLWLAIMVVL